MEPIGITSSYSTLLRVIEEVGDSCYENILNELKNGKKYRLIGDNVNFRVGKKFQRSNEKQSQQYHWFASCAIIQNCEFSQYSDVPQGPVRGLDLTHILPSESDIAALKTNYTCHIAKVAKELIPALSFLATTDIRSEYPDIIQKKNGSILLPVQPLNEQCYSDVVKILDSYQEFVTEINEKSETSFDSIQIGGDQLTRERFSGAKTLRGGAYTAKERFENLYPISFELFHTSMNFLELMFKVLFKKKTFDKGTLNGEKVKLNRSSVHEDVKNHYDDDKDFVVSFVKSYIAAALMEFFGIKDRASTLTKNKPPSDPSELKKWQEEVLETFLDEYIFKRDQQITCTHKTLNLMLPDGTQIQIHIPLSNPQNPSTTNQNTKDDVYKYGVLVMELGLMFLEFQDVCKSPDRARLMTVMKCMMMMFKTVNNNSKYALEILRFLCFHQASYSLQTSYQSIHGLFVNTQGKLDSSIPADLHMEHMVKKTKSMLKSLGSNKTPEIIVKRSKALAGMDAISHHYDTDTNVILRSHHHKLKNANDDEIKMIQDIMEVNPFVYTPGRSFEFFKGLTSPLLFSINDNKYKAWVEHHKSILDYDSGK